MRIDGGRPIGHAHAMRIPFLTLATTFLTIVAAPADAQTTLLTGAEAWKAVVGNTIVGKTPSGEAIVEYFAPDGAARQRVDGKSAEGSWTLRGAKVCTDYSSDDDDEDDSEASDADSGDDEEAECFGLSAQGDRLTLTDDAGKARDFRILAGNAEKL